MPEKPVFPFQNVICEEPPLAFHMQMRRLPGGWAGLGWAEQQGFSAAGLQTGAGVGKHYISSQPQRGWMRHWSQGHRRIKLEESKPALRGKLLKFKIAREVISASHTCGIGDEDHFSISEERFLSPGSENNELLEILLSGYQRAQCGFFGDILQ